MYEWQPFEWEPDNDMPLVIYRDDGDGFSVSVTVISPEPEEEEGPGEGEEPSDPLEPPPDPNHFSVEGLDPTIDFSFTGNTWTIEADKAAAASSFPIEITYLQTKYEDSMNVVTSWEDLPVDSEEIIKLETLGSSPLDNTFTVTASYFEGDAEEPEYSESKSYSIRIIHVYTANAERLKLEVDLRR